jgi:nitroreductase
MKKVLFTFFVIALFSSCVEQKEEQKVEIKSKSSVVYETIMSRRSIRSYKPEQVSKAQLDTILQCAIYAPSANNAQSWQVRVIQNQQLMDRIREINANFSYGAPSLIVVAKDKESGISSVDCGLLAENIVVIAEAMDLGTVILGSAKNVFNDPKAKDIVEELDFPDTHEIIFAIAVGYKDKIPATASERDASKAKLIE